MLKFRFIFFILFILSGCANMNESDCLAADWQTIGFEDGATGKNESIIGQHRKECAKHGVAPDLAAYRKGHLAGSERFCTLRNGFHQGKKGINYSRSCPANLEDKFLKGYADGQQLYSLSKILKQRTKELENAYARIDFLDHQIAEKRELMIADGLNREQRKSIRDEIEYHQHEQAELFEILPDLQAEFEASQHSFEETAEQFSHY